MNVKKRRVGFTLIELLVVNLPQEYLNSQQFLAIIRECQTPHYSHGLE